MFAFLIAQFAEGQSVSRHSGRRPELMTSFRTDAELAGWSTNQERITGQYRVSASVPCQCVCVPHFALFDLCYALHSMELALLESNLDSNLESNRGIQLE